MTDRMMCWGTQGIRIRGTADIKGIPAVMAVMAGQGSKTGQDRNQEMEVS